MKLVKGEIYMVWFDDEKLWAETEYIGNTKSGCLKMESTTFGDIYLISKDLRTVTVLGRTYDITRID